MTDPKSAQSGDKTKDSSKSGRAPDEERLLSIQNTVRKTYGYLGVAFFFTLVLNMIMLVSPVYMLQVYDRVMTSGSVETLIVLTIIAVFLFMIYIAADAGRKRVLANAGQNIGSALDAATLRAGLNDAKSPPTAIIENIGNLAKVQGFFVNGTIAPLLDLPFAPLFIGILFMVHPFLGAIGLIGAFILLGLAIIANQASTKTVKEAAMREGAAQAMLGHTARQRAAIVSMGIGERAIQRWRDKRHYAIDESLRAVNTSNYLTSISRSFRQVLQVFILGAGAWLALQHQISSGAIVAGSIIMGRGLAPIDQSVAIWRILIQTRQSWAALKDYLQNSDSVMDPDAEHHITRMPRPEPVLKLEEFTVSPPGSEKPLLPQISFELPRGSITALLGPSGAGKTSLMQTIAGAWHPQAGTARLGGRDIHTWDADDRGRFVGYLPQHVELLTGTVFENIARFTQAEPEEVYAAAKQAGCHEMILSFPKGYDTPIGEKAAYLSAGQRQSVGLARAFFGNPALLLLDEPTAHLDINMVGVMMQQFAEIARTPAKERDSTYIIATHDLRLINASDQVLVIQNRQVALMPRDEYLKKVSDLNQRRQAQQQAQQQQAQQTKTPDNDSSQTSEKPKLTFSVDPDQKKDKE
ncbi:MAG: type I secretion system permease/ATPase [bacterium]